MTNAIRWVDIDPDDTDYRIAVWCSKDGTNDGGTTDTGDLQGATISTSNWAITPSGSLAEDSEDTAEISVQGVTYAVNTSATIWLSGATEGVTYTCTNTIVTSDSRTLDKSFEIKGAEQ